MGAFTPGPWYPGHLGEEGRCQCTGIVDGGYAGGIASVHVDNGIKSISEGGNDCPPRVEAIANMHLIAAAPDLYAALQELQKWALLLSMRVDEASGARLMPDHATLFAALALAKAEGRS